MKRLIIAALIWLALAVVLGAIDGSYSLKKRGSLIGEAQHLWLMPAKPQRDLLE